MTDAKTDAKLPGVGVDHVCKWSYGTIDSAFSPPAIDLALSPDGKTIAFTSCADDKQAQRGMLLDVASGALKPIDDASEIHRIRFSPDGKYVYYAAFARGADAKTIELRVHAVGGAFEKKIPFFTSTPEKPLLDQRVEGFDVKFSPDGKTAVALGYDVIGDDERDGLAVVAPLDKDGVTTLHPSGPIASNADVMWAPTGERMLILTSMPARSQGIGEARPQRVTEIDLSIPDQPVATTPAWVRAGATGESIVVPGSFDGARVLRWDGDAAIPGGGGHVVIANVDGTQIDVSKAAGVFSNSPHYFWDSEMRDLRAARWVGDGDAKAVVFPGIASAGETAVTIFSRAADGTITKLATDAAPAALGGGFVTATTASGAILYPQSKGSLGIIEKNAARTLVKAPDGESVTFRSASPDGSKVLVSIAAPAFGSRTDYAVVDVATGKQTMLVPSKTDKLRISGDLDGEWAPDECRYDMVEASNVANDGSAFMLVSFFTSLTTCKRAYLPPEMWSVRADGTLGGSVSVADFALPAEARGWVDGPSARAVGADRVLLTQCGFDKWNCAAHVTTAPAVAPAAEPTGPAKPSTPTKPAKQPATGDDDDDGATAAGESSDAEELPSTSAHRAPAPGSEAAAAPAAPPAIPPSTPASCSAAPGTHGSWAPFVVIAIAFGAALRRRKKAAVLAAGLGLAGCSSEKDPSTAAATANVDSAPAADPFAKSIVDIATLDRDPSEYYGSVFGIRDPQRVATRLADEIAPYYGGCVFAGCARMLDPATDKVQDASTLGVFIDSKGSTNDAAWRISPKRQWVVFRKGSGDPDKAAGNGNLIAFADLDHGDKAIALPPSGADVWVTDDLLVQIVSTTHVRGVDPKTLATKFEVDVPEPDQKYGLTLPAFTASADASTLLVAGNKAAKVIHVADFSVHDVAGWDALDAPSAEPLPSKSGFVVTSTSTHYSRYAIASLAADATLKTLADSAQPAVAIASDGRFAYARPATADRPSNTAYEDATVVIHDEGKPDVELTTKNLSGGLTFSPDGKWIKAETSPTYSTFARTDASGAMKPMVPAFDDQRNASELWITRSYSHAVVAAPAAYPKQDDVNVYAIDLATGAKKELLHDAKSVPSNGVLVEDSASDPAIFAQTGAGTFLLNLAGDKLAAVNDVEFALGWSHGWLFYLVKPATDTYPWRRQLRAVSRDGKQNVAVGGMLDEIVSVIRGDWSTQPRGDTLESFVLRSGMKVFALVPPSYDPNLKAPTPAPAPKGDETSSGDDGSGAPIVTPPAQRPGTVNEPRPSADEPAPASDARGRASTSTAAPTPTTPTTENITTAACSAAPGSHPARGFGVGFLLALALLARRRRVRT